MKKTYVLVSTLLFSQGLLAVGYFEGIEQSAINPPARDYTWISVLLGILSLVFFAVATWAWRTRKKKNHPLSGVLGTYVITILYLASLATLYFVF